MSTQGNEFKILSDKVHALTYSKNSIEIIQYQHLKRRLRFTFRESFNPPGSFGDKRVVRKGITKYLLDHFYSGNFYYRVRLTFSLSGSFEDFLKSITIIDAKETTHPDASRSVIERPETIVSEILSLAKH